MTTSWFSNPWALYLTALMPLLAMLSLRAWRKRRAALAQLGSMHGLLLVRRGPRILRGLCLFVGLMLLIAGAAGPQWDIDTNPEALAGPTRDVVVVLDLSRSMLAEHPSRQELALRGLNHLCETFKKRGGYRVALVVFAGRAKLVFPLTNDYDHFAETLMQQDADYLPSDLRPDPERGDASGTRIGAALRLAIDAHDPQMEGAQDIILLSDGDDPVADQEWQTAIEPARDKKIPIHTVGVGTPKSPAFIPDGDDVLRDENSKEVVTTLHEKPLQEIARRTRGIYIPAHTKALPLGRLFEDIVASRPLREAQAQESAVSILYVQRFEWFLAGALLFLTATLLIPDGGFRAPSRFAYRSLRLALVPLAILLISAAYPEQIDELMRQGQAAFDAEEYSDALELYQQAENNTLDPGLVAFNKAACLYRMKKYQEAENHYRRSLEDQQIPGTRAAWAWHALGNCLVKKPPARLDHVEEAIRCYRRCLAHGGANAELQADAAHNLEVAKRLWIKLKAEGKEPPKDPDKDESQQPAKKEASKEAKEKQVPKEVDDGTEQGGNQKKKVPGGAYVLPDNDEVLPLPKDATERLLDEAVRRIRRDWRNLAGTSPAGVKDW